jgi:drug/metabolite transporter (DMT)-like permease
MPGQGKEKERVFIWAWVGLVLATFGLIVLGTGLAQFSRPPDTVLGNLHPRIWWGGIMALTGLLFVAVDLPILPRR